jgi:hypothetical protein
MDKVAEQVEEKKRRNEYPYDGARKVESGDAKLLGELSQSAGTPDSNFHTFKLAEFKRTIAPLVNIFPEVEW